MVCSGGCTFGEGMAMGGGTGKRDGSVVDDDAGPPV
jgi:hypothetical protein